MNRSLDIQTIRRLADMIALQKRDIFKEPFQLGTSTEHTTSGFISIQL